MRTITNDYRDAEILDLGTGYETGPFLVTQMGIGPNQPVPKTFMLSASPRWTVGVLQRLCLQRKTGSNGRARLSHDGRSERSFRETASAATDLRFAH